MTKCMRAVARTFLATTAVAVALATTGCASQISALAPVGGDNIYKVRVATIDVLLAQGVGIKSAPVCTQEPDQVSCAGTTIDDQAIAVTAPGKGKTTFTVSVGGAVVHEGPVSDVIDQAAGAK